MTNIYLIVSDFQLELLFLLRRVKQNDLFSLLYIYNFCRQMLNPTDVFLDSALIISQKIQQNFLRTDLLISYL